MPGLNEQNAVQHTLVQSLYNDVFSLMLPIVCGLQGLEEEAASIQSNIDQGHEDKRGILADIVKAEREVCRLCQSPRTLLCDL